MIIAMIITDVFIPCRAIYQGGPYNSVTNNEICSDTPCSLQVLLSGERERKKCTSKYILFCQICMIVHPVHNLAHRVFAT